MKYWTCEAEQTCVCSLETLLDQETTLDNIVSPNTVDPRCPSFKGVPRPKFGMGQMRETKIQTRGDDFFVVELEETKIREAKIQTRGDISY